MFEVIKDYCEFHKVALVVNYKASTGIWAVCLFNEHMSTGHHSAEDLSSAFNDAKKYFEANKGE
jgi:hypothetical protein